jgi:hypothetical protein
MIRTKWYIFTKEQKDQMKKDALTILAQVCRNIEGGKGWEERNLIKNRGEGEGG